MEKIPRYKFRTGLLALAFMPVLFWLVAGSALAGPAYRRLETSNPAMDSWQEGMVLTIATDQNRCKKAYGDRWINECAAPPAGKAGQLVEGVQMSPPVPGVWRWINSTSMRFEPKKHLSPDTAYTISLTGVKLPSRFDLARDIVYRSQCQAVSIGSETLWIDPSDQNAHVLSVPVEFVWPVDRKLWEQKIRLAPTSAELRFAQPSLVWNATNDKVVVNARILSLPERNVMTNLTVSDVSPFARKDGQRQINQKLKKAEMQMRISGTSELMKVQEISIEPAYNDNLGRDFQIEVKTSLQTRAGDVAKYLDIIQLPMKSSEGAGTNCNWEAMPAISQADINNGKKLTASLLQPEGENASTVRLSVPAKPGSYLLMAMKGGLPARNGLTLAKVARFIRKVPEMQAEINLLQPGNILAFGKNQRIDVHTIGIDKLKWRVERVREPFLALLAKQTGFTHNEEESEPDFDSLSDAWQGELPVAPVGGKAGGAAYASLDPVALQAGNGKTGARSGHGLLRLILTGHVKDREVCETKRLILFTDLGMMYKTAADRSSTAFVRSLSSGKALQNVEIRLLGSNGQPVLAARTDANGRADLPSANGLIREKRPVAVVALLGNDMTWMPLQDGSRVLDYSDFKTSGLHASASGLSASLYSQRGIYMPGETMHFGCLIRRQDWGKLPENTPLLAELHDPAGNCVLRSELTLGSDGLASFAWKSGLDSAVGTYKLDLLMAGDKNAEKKIIGTTTVRLEEFQPDTLAMRLAITDRPKGWIRLAPASKVAASVHLDNLYGDPAPGHRIKSELRLEPARLQFSGFDGYTFCDNASEDGNSNTISLPDTFTDKAGNAPISLPLEKFRTGTSLGTLMVEGFEAGSGRAVGRAVQALFSPRAMIVGYKPENAANNLEYVPQNSKAGLHLLAVDNDLSRLELANLSVSFSARRYVNSLVSDSSGNYFYDATPVDTEISRTSFNLAKGGSSLPLPTENAGDFLVTVRNQAGEILASVPYSVAGLRLAEPDSLDSSLLKRGALRLRLEKSELAAGETINFSISTPYEGTGLVTIERESVVSHAWFAANAGDSVHSIAIPRDFEGRGYLNVSFVRASSSQTVYMNPHVHAVAPFTAGISKRNMGLKITAPDSVLPGSEMAIQLESSVPGRVQLFAVDEGVLQLTGFATPDPLADLLTNRALDVTSRQAFDLLMPDHERLRGRIPGFGGGMGNPGGRFLNPFRRKNEPPFAFWSKILVLDGKASVNIPVPEYFSGSVRIMAVGTASSGEKLAAGSAEANSRVRGTIVIKPQLPLAASPGDVFEGAVVIGNTIAGSGKNAQVRLDLNLPDGLALLDGKKSLRLGIDENGEKAISFRVKVTDSANALGDAAISFVAENEKSGQVRRSQSISIRPAGQKLRTEELVELQGPGQRSIEINRTIYPWQARTRLTVANGPVLALGAVLERLDDYAFGCTEQCISRAMPYLAMWNAPQVRELVMKSARRSKQAMQKRGLAAIARAIDAIRASSGWEGVAAWPGMDNDNIFMTALAGDFLVMLRENGLNVPEDLAENVLSALERMVSRTPTGVEDARYKAYGIWVLLRDGRIVTSALDNLHKWITGGNLNNWENDIMAALMADSYASLRMRTKAAGLLPASNSQGTSDPRFSTAMSRSLHALILTRSFQDRSDRINTRALLDASLSGNSTTIDMAMTARALVKLASDLAPNPGALELACGEMAPGFESPDQGAMPGNLAVLDAPGCRRFNISVGENAGQNLHAAIMVEGFDRTPPQAMANGLELKRSYLDENGEPVRAAKLGDVLEVRLCGRAPGNETNDVAIIDLMPGGLEPVLEKDPENNADDGLIRRERREDRSIFFVNLNSGERCFSYKARATTRGSFTLPSAQAEAMYEPAKNAVTGGGTFEVR